MSLVDFRTIDAVRLSGSRENEGYQVLRFSRFEIVTAISLCLAHAAIAMAVASDETRPAAPKPSESSRSVRAASAKATAIRPFEWVTASRDSAVLAVHQDQLRSAAEQGRPFTVEGLSVSANQTVDLELTPMHVVGPKTRVVLGRASGIDEPLPFDWTAIQAFHGKVRGQNDSRVVMYSSPRGVRAHVDLGASDQRYLLSTVASSAQVAGAPLAEIRRVTSQSDRTPDVPLCGRDLTATSTDGPNEGGVAGCCFEPDISVTYHQRTAVTEIAIETDYDLYANFNDATVTTDYVIELMARTNDIFLRDIHARFEVVFIRIFENPGDELPFMGNADPLNGYVNYWNNNMGGVARDTGAFLTGRRDLPYGGIAYIGAVCSNFAYCVCGYLNGFPDPNIPNSGDYDLGVTAHELGHNFNGCHTPDYCPQIDTCFPPPVTPQRGTMMSYCSQTVSGGNMVTELWYHSRLKRVMRDFVEFSAFCLTYDCNNNGIDDEIDRLTPGSDVNANFVLDVCEDCNANSVLDPVDIASATSLDVNGNSIPDECEADCNNNNVPDEYETRLDPKSDIWGNGVPDECDPDCDGLFGADYNQIQANLSLDIDRNVILDACQDCDNDGINDLVELMGARNAWVASDVLNYITEFHAVSGVRVKISTTGLLNAAQDLIITPGDRVLVSSGNTDKIVAFHAITGVSMGDFVPTGSGGLDFPTGLTIAPDGNLLVSSRNTHSVLRYDGTTGAFLGAFVSGGSGGLANPFGLVYGPNGNLYVTSGGNQVLEFDGVSGAFVRVFVSTGDNGGLSGARGIVFMPDGSLLVASYNTDALLRYDGTSGAFLGKWNSGGTNDALYLDGPWGLRIGPNGNVFASRDLPALLSGDDHDHDHDHDHEWEDHAQEFVAPLHVTAARIMEFDIANGQYLQSYVLGDDTGLRSTTGFDFMPGTADCNFNLLPDSCDLAACSGNPACADCNANSRLDSCDIASCDGDPSCADCNTNGTPDGCDITAGTSFDVDPADGIPDECTTIEPPPGALADPSGLGKVRFISFAVPASTIAGGIETALRIRLVSLHHVVPPYTGGPSVPFTSFEGQVRWAGPPASFVESSVITTPVVVSQLQCTPHYRDWSTIPLLNVTGSAIVPSSLYQVENLAASCAGNEAGCLAVSDPLEINTVRWGDIETPYNPPSATVQPDVADISSLVNKFRSVPTAPNKARALLAGPPPFGIVNPAPDLDFSHISACVDAFRGLPYPYTIEACP